MGLVSQAIGGKARSTSRKRRMSRLARNARLPFPCRSVPIASASISTTSPDARAGGEDAVGVAFDSPRPCVHVCPLAYWRCILNPCILARRVAKGVEHRIQSMFLRQRAIIRYGLASLTVVCAYNIVDSRLDWFSLTFICIGRR